MEVWRDPSGAQGLGVQPFQVRKNSGMSQQHLVSPRTCPGFLRHSPQHVTGRMSASGDIVWVSIVFRHSNKAASDSSGCTHAKSPRVPGIDQGRAPLGFYGRYSPAALPPRPVPWQRGGKAKVTLVGWLCSPWSQAGASQSPHCVCTRSLPKTLVLSPAPGVAGGRCGVAGDLLGVMSWVCTSCHMGTPWRDLPAPKVTVLPGTRLPTGYGMCSHRAVPVGGGTSAPAPAPPYFSLPGSFVFQE